MGWKLPRSAWKDWRLCAALLAVGIGIAVRLHNAFYFPIDFGFDAPFNRSYIERLFGSWALPAPDAEWATAHAPLFYYLSAALVRLGGWKDPGTWIPMIRLVGTAAGLGVIALAVTIVRRAAPGDARRAVLAAAVLIFLPVHIYMSAMLSEEMLTAFFSSVALAGVIGMSSSDRPLGSVGRAAWIGCAVGAALLTKLSGALVGLTVVAVYALSGLRSGAWRAAIARIAILTLFMLLVGGWHYARNLIEHGYLYPYAMPFHQVMASMPPGERGIGDYLRVPLATFTDPQLMNPDLLRSVWGSTYATVWFDGHRHFLPLASEAARKTGTWLLVLALLPTVAFARALARGVRRSVRSKDTTDSALVLFVVLTLAGYTLFTARNPQFATIKGSYLLSLCVPFAFYASEALAAWTRRGGVRSAIVWLLLAALALAVPPTFSYGLVFEKAELPGLSWLESAQTLGFADSPSPVSITLASETRMATFVTSPHQTQICLPAITSGKLAVEIGAAAAARGAKLSLKFSELDTTEASLGTTWSRIRVELADRSQGCIDVEVSGAPGTKVALSKPLVIRPGLPRPWVLLYVVDGLRFDATPYAGIDVESGSGFANLAADGILYRRAFATSSWARSAVASLLTGLHPSAHGVLDRKNRLPKRIRRLPISLSWSGWQGVAFSSNADIHPKWGFQPGFERFVTVNSQPPAGADDLRQRVVAFVERYADRPVFLYVHDNEPSAPHLPRNEPRARLDTPPAANPSEPPHEAGDEEEFGLARSLYRAEVQSASERFEAVLEALREVGRYEEALVVLVGAYGAELGEHGGTRQGRTLLQEQLHVPLVIKPPAGSPIRGEVTDAVSLVDLFPTLLPLLGVAPPPYQAGRRLPLPGETAQNSAVVRSQLQLDRAAAESVIFWPWKYLRLGSEVEHLYDLSADPGEQKDLRDAEPAILESMRRKLEQRTR